jgi:hypothetical protein
MHLAVNLSLANHAEKIHRETVQSDQPATKRARRNRRRRHRNFGDFGISKVVGHAGKIVPQNMCGDAVKWRTFEYGVPLVRKSANSIIIAPAGKTKLPSA